MALAISIGALYVLRYTLELMLNVGDIQKKYARPGMISSLKDVMYGLIYPAVLGTGMVLAVLRIAKEHSLISWMHDPSLYVGCAASRVLYSFLHCDG